jgi:biotin carboxylase
MTDVDLVLVGYRPPALHAASRLGLRVLLVHDFPPSAAAKRRLVGSVVAPLEGDPGSVVDRTQAALGSNVAPLAVVSAGERGVLAAAALRESYGLGGIDRRVAHVARDKPSMKAAARAQGIPCTDWLTLDPSSKTADLIEALGLPVVLKVRDGSGTRSLIVARTEEEVEGGLASIAAGDRKRWMAERFVAAPEMSVESFVRDGEILFTNPTEYYVPGFSSIAPASLSEEEAASILALNANVISALELNRGMTHLELYRTPSGPLFGEVAVRPPGGRLMRLIRRAYSFDPWEVVMQLELGLPTPALPSHAKRAAGAWMFHPGAGRVVSVRGLAAARRVKGVKKLVCRTRAGRKLAARDSTGSDVGWIEVSGKNRDQVARRLQAAHDLVKITMERDV